MDTSAWFEQVDRAWIELIKRIVTLPDVSINVFVRVPDKDFKVEKYPSISIYGLYTQFDEDRYYPTQNHVEVDRDLGLSYTTEKSKPFKLNYQIDFWSLFKTDMNAMSAQWLSKFAHHFNMPIVDASGEERTLFVKNRESYTPRDYFEKKERIFHSTITYQVWGDLDLQVPVVGDIAKEVVIETVDKGD